MIDEVVEGFFRILGKFLYEFLFEFFFKGPGKLIVRLYSREKAEAEGFHVYFWSVAFWLSVAMGIGYTANSGVS